MMKELNSNYLLQEEAEMIASQRKSKFFEKISLICSLRQAQEIQYLGTQAQTRWYLSSKIEQMLSFSPSSSKQHQQNFSSLQ